MTATEHRDVVDILTDDHHEVLDLIGTIAALSPAERRDAADTVIAELVRHSVAEEMYVYPAMRDHVPGGQAEVEHDTQEHQELEETMKALEGADAATPEFLTVLQRLEEQLRHHASDEENDQFPKLREALTPDDLVNLGVKVTAAKKAAPTRPHPGAPHSELFHKTFGAGVGLVDKVRDALTGRARNT